MRRYVVTAVLAAALLTGCEQGFKNDGGPAVTSGKVIGKSVTEPDSVEPCYRFTLSRVDRVWDKKERYWKSAVSIGYVCVSIARWDELKVGDKYDGNPGTSTQSGRVDRLNGMAFHPDVAQ